MFTQPVASEHESFVHPTLSSHAEFTATCPQPAVASQESVVHAKPSSQSSGDPLTHTPCERSQVSVPLQTSLSSHSEFMVQPTSHTPLWHRPLLPAPLVQVEPSTTSVLPQPPVASQESAVHGLLSSQLAWLGVNTQAVPSQELAVQATPSSQRASSGWNWQSIVASHTSSVQGTLSLHAVSTGIDVQPTPGWQTSVVQPTPSSHCVLSAKLLQTPFEVLHVSVVQETPSEQSLSCVQPVLHSPPLHMPALPAPSVQDVPSVAVVAEQPPSVQTSTVHSLPSSHAASSST